MDFLIDAIGLAFEGCEPSSKYCYLKLTQQHIGTATKGTMKDVAKQLGVHDHALATACKELEKLNLIRRDAGTTYSEVKGPDIQVVETGLQQLQAATRGKCPIPPPIHHRPFIEHLLGIHAIDAETSSAPQNRHSTVSTARRTGTLTLPTKLLLIVLFRYADQGGAVTQLSLTELCRLTGMSKEKAYTQLEKLMHAGYIRSSYSGLTGRYLFGTTKGGYFLNLAHPDFVNIHTGQLAITWLPSLVMLHPASALAAFQRRLNLTFCKQALSSELPEARRFIRNIPPHIRRTPSAELAPIPWSWNRPVFTGIRLKDVMQGLFDYSQWIPPSIRIAYLVPALREIGDPKFEAMLHAFLNDVASLLLSDHWNRLRVSDCKKFRLAGKLTDNQLQRIVGTKLTSPWEQNQLKRLVGYMAYKWALAIKQVVICSDLQFPTLYRFTILPSTRRSTAPNSLPTSINILCSPKDEFMENEGKVIVVRTVSHSGYSDSLSKGEELRVHELTAQHQWELGLLSTPPRKADFEWKKQYPSKQSNDASKKPTV